MLVVFRLSPSARQNVQHTFLRGQAATDHALQEVCKARLILLRIHHKAQHAAVSRSDTPTQSTIRTPRDHSIMDNPACLKLPPSGSGVYYDAAKPPAIG